MSRKALVLLVCCCDFRDGAERLIPSKSLGNAVIRAFPGLFRILRMCAPRHAAAVVRPRERKKSADRRRRILISRLLIIRASVPRRKSPFPAYFKGFPAVSLLIPPYPAFLKYPVSPQMALIRQRTAQLQRQARARQMLLIDAGCMAACLVLVVCLGLAMPGWAGTSVALHVSPTGTAGMLSERGADGYILVGVLSFLLGSCVTILLYRLRRSNEKKHTRDDDEL